MKKTFILLAALLALGTTTMALAQHGGPGGPPPGGGGGQGGPGGGGPSGGGKHNPSEIGGVVSALAADGSSFTLTGPHGDTLTVNVSSTTTVKNESDKSAATLANGENVDVIGTLDSTGKILAATSIFVDDFKLSYFGTVSALAADGSSFTLTGPHGETLTVNVSSTTTIKNESDKSAATLANGENVIVTGTPDATGKIITAAAIVVDDAKYKYVGMVTALSADGSSFTLTGPRKETATVNVSATTSITKYSDGSVAALANGENVIVTGTLDATGKIITATAIVVDDRQPPKPMAAALGTILSLDATADTFVLTVTKASFTPTGTTITVVTTASTAYCGPKGKLTFADLTVGAKVLVSGIFDATTQTLTVTHVDVSK